MTRTVTRPTPVASASKTNVYKLRIRRLKAKRSTEFSTSSSVAGTMTKNMSESLRSKRAVQTTRVKSKILVMHGGIELTIVKAKTRAKSNHARSVSSKMVIHPRGRSSGQVKIMHEEGSFGRIGHHSA
jgi:hypothetical protein